MLGLKLIIHVSQEAPCSVSVGESDGRYDSPCIWPTACLRGATILRTNGIPPVYPINMQFCCALFVMISSALGDAIDLTYSHYNDVIMTTVASQITSLTVVYSTVYSEADQRKHQSSASLAFVWGIHRDRWIPRTKGQLRGKCFHLMTSSCSDMIYWLCTLNSFPYSMHK